MSAINGIANDLLAEHFPGVTQRYDVCKDYMEKKYSLSLQFGRFWNWCLNAARTSSGLTRPRCVSD
ncbi:hypothetical protein CPB85DRAFT_1325371 [Mucidula mucida]|nr:hypothetical protein CPB85DRAFT_1325371 [Mucidula mucida]